MEPRIRYAPTADGVSIAFWTLGDGVPLVYMAGGRGATSRRAPQDGRTSELRFRALLTQNGVRQLEILRG
jgi:hypothetical protein